MNSFEFIRSAAAGLLNSLLAGIAMAALAWFLARIAGRHNPRARFAVWFVALIGIALLPWVGSAAACSSATLPISVTGAVTLPEFLAYYLVIAWIIGAALGLAHLAHGLYRLRRLRETCAPVDLDRLDPLLRVRLAEIQPRRRVTLCVSDAVRVPAAIGYLRPMVVFPSWALAEIPPQELNAILLHELAHLRRFDDWTNLAQKLVKAVFFFHPAVWFIESRLTLEREMACDDAVLSANFSPRAYAESLVALAEKSFLRHRLQLAQAAVEHVRQLRLRLAEILRKDRIGQGSAPIGGPTLALLSLAAMLAVYGAARAPRLVAFAPGSAGAIAEASPRAVQPMSEPILQPVNLSYSTPGAVARVAPKPRARNIHRAAPKPRVLFPQLAALDRAAADKSPSAVTLLANFPTEANADSVLVVFQGEQFGPNGPVLWSIAVFHLTPAQHFAVSGGIPKQI